MAWATIDDLVLLFPSAADEPEDRLQLILDSAAGIIAERLRDAGVDTSDPCDQLQANLRTVNLWVAGRALPTGGMPFGASSWSQTAGPVSQTVTNDMGVGNLYLTSTELAMLGVSGTGRGTQLFCSEDVLGGDGGA